MEAHDADPPPDPNDQPAPTVQDLSDALAEGAEGDAVAPVDLSISPAGRWMVVADSGAPRLIALNLSQFGQAVPLVNRVRSFVLPEGDTPGSVEISYDGDYLYILCPGSQRLYRARLRDELASLIPIIPDEGQDFSMLPLVNAPVAGAPPNPLPLDVSVSPRDNWVYILRRLFNPDGSPRDRGDIIIVDAQGMNENPGMTGISEEMARELRQQGSFINGNALFHQLAFLGQRVYAAGETPTEPAEGEEEPPESTEGSISILFVNEAACDTFIRKTVDGCSPCPDPNQGVVIASIQGYLWNQPMVNEQVADQNFIDNYTHRQMVPSTNTLRQVIECMLDKGISEGIPGPRGAVGPEGRRGQGIVEVSADTLNPGSPATASLEPVNPDTDPQGDQRLNLGLPRGDAGQRGPGIREVLVRPLSAGQPPTAGLTPIPDHPLGDQTLDLGLPPGAGITDVAVETGPLNARLEPIDPANPNGDQRLILTIPQGESGEAGPPGPGITQVTVQTLPPGSNATASLTPIPGDPQGNQRLNLGIPRGAQGPPGVVEPGNFNQVVAASWHHEQIMTTQEFARLVVSGIGLSVVFREPVRTITLHSRSAYLLVSRAESGGILGSLVCQCILPTEVRRFSEGSTNPETIRWLVGLDQVLRDEFELVRNLDGGPLEDTDDFARVVQLVLPENFQDPSALESMIGEMRELTGRRFLTLSVVLKGDWIIDENGNALDGNNIWPGVPEQPTATGLPGRLSGNGTQGDDWISLIHIRSVQD